MVILIFDGDLCLSAQALRYTKDAYQFDCKVFRLLYGLCAVVRSICMTSATERALCCSSRWEVMSRSKFQGQ